jgi:hypothetical protein
VKILCEAKTGHISNIKIYTAERKELEEIVVSLLENNFGFHQVYQDNFHNVKVAENHLEHK